MSDSGSGFVSAESVYASIEESKNGTIYIHFSPKLPARATRTVPGTAARIEIYASRAARGESLWHPYDLTFRDIQAESRHFG